MQRRVPVRDRLAERDERMIHREGAMPEALLHPPESLLRLPKQVRQQFHRHHEAAAIGDSSGTAARLGAAARCHLAAAVLVGRGQQGDGTAIRRCVRRRYLCLRLVRHRRQRKPG